MFTILPKCKKKVCPCRPLLRLIKKSWLVPNDAAAHLRLRLTGDAVNASAAGNALQETAHKARDLAAKSWGLTGHCLANARADCGKSDGKTGANGGQRRDPDGATLL